ncbi:MAG: penicillin-binding transpeptidase domain-containing protein [Longicatena sp.]
MNLKRSNRTLFLMTVIMGIIGTLIISNVLFTMVTQKHLRSGINVKDFKDADISNTSVVKANRGTIYDRDSEVIAQDEDTFTLVAMMSESRVGINNVPAYVQNITKTARLLAPKLGMNEEDIATQLEQAKQQKKYQTELGTKGRGLSTNVKESIEALNLPGITFTKTVKRNYPTSSFASHLVGYAQFDEKTENIVGKMGLEDTLNKYLTGSDGEEVYQKDAYDNILPGTKYTKKYAENGNDVYLTLDRNVQLTLQSSLEKTVTKTNGGKLGWAIAMEVETGKVLGYASYPSFDMNKRDDLKDFNDVPAKYLYEPGSVMKGITYAAAIDTGKYPYNQNFNSGVFYYGLDANGNIVRISSSEGSYPPIKDALGQDHGTISFDKGFIISSNIGICELLSRYMSPEVYKEYVEKFGFTKQVNIPFVANEVGRMSWTYPSDKLSTGFGQSISINALQMAQAYTAIFNEGKMVRPYVVERIEEANTHKIVEQYDTKQVGTPISKKTAEYMCGLMKQVASDPEGTALSYAMGDVDILAKTGTGEIAGPKGYDTGIWTTSVMMAAPADDPKVMIYYAFQASDILNYSREPMKEAMRAALVSANITGEEKKETPGKTYKEWKDYKMPSLLNHSLDYMNKKMTDIAVNKIVIGNGSGVIKQYPAEGETIVSNQNVFLLTDGSTITMPDMSGWTKKDITAFWDMTNIEVQMSGTGSVTSQDIPKDKPINTDTIIKVVMK